MCPARCLAELPAEYRSQGRGLGSVMGAQGNTAVDERIADPAPHLPAPDGLAAPERAAPYGVGEVAFLILVHP